MKTCAMQESHVDLWLREHRIREKYTTSPGFRVNRQPEALKVLSLIADDPQESNQKNKNQAMLPTCNLYRETAGRQRDERQHKGAGSRKGGGQTSTCIRPRSERGEDFTGESGGVVFKKY